MTFLPDAPTIVAFRRGGAGEACLREGWSRPEDAFTWSDGLRSALELRVPDAPGDLYLELSLGAFTCKPDHPRQRLTITIEDRALFSGTVEGDTCIGFLLPRASWAADRPLHISMDHPDAVAPQSLGLGGDYRRLACALRQIAHWRVPARADFSPILRAPLPLTTITGDGREHALARYVTGLSLRDLSLAFESFGLNCEFGMFQRRCGAEPLGLLRFGGLNYPDLLRGIEAKFDGLETPALLTCHVEQEDWMVRNSRYGISFHTLRMPAEIGAEALLADYARGLRFRREKFAEILATGEKLFVINRPEGMTPPEALPLLMRLRRFGPNALLFISAATGLAPGSVEALAPHLFRGAMDGVTRFGKPEELEGRDNWLSDAGMAFWVSLCAHSYRLWREQRGW